MSTVRTSDNTQEEADVARGEICDERTSQVSTETTRMWLRLRSSKRSTSRSLAGLLGAHNEVVRHATASSKGRRVGLEFGYRELMAVDGLGVAFSVYVDSEATRHNKRVCCRRRDEECGRLDSTLSNVLIYCASVCGIS